MLEVIPSRFHLAQPGYVINSGRSLKVGASARETDARLIADND
jgi:hypothetical protein